MLAGVFAGAGSDLGRQQVHDRAILVGRPHAAVMAQEAGTGALLPAKAARAVEQPRHKPFEADRDLPKATTKFVYDPIDHTAADQCLADRSMGGPVRTMRQEIRYGD